MCHKIEYDSKKLAKQKAKAMLVLGDYSRNYPYFCNQCKKWHLSKSK